MPRSPLSGLSLVARATVVLAGSAALHHPLAAQVAARRAADDSIQILPGTRATAASTGAGVAVLDSIDIANSGARTLSELLQARVAGLSVGYRGGTENDGADVRSRGLSSPSTFAPMLVIDGVLADGDQRVSLPGTEVAPSRLDDLTPADVERVEILRGPAAAALYGLGAANGVIVVTTRRGADGPLRVAANLGSRLVDVGSPFPDNYELTSGAPGATCPLGPAAPGCAPGTVYRWNPLAQASPFRTGVGRSGAASVSGTVLGAHLFAGGAAERVDGATSDDRDTRQRLRASAERTLPGRLSLAVSGGVLRRDGSAPSRGLDTPAPNVIQSGLIGTAYDDSAHGYRYDGYGGPPTGVRVADPATTRSTGAARLDWRPLGWLTVTALGGRDRVRQTSSRSLQQASSSDVERAGYEFTSGTMHVGAESRWSRGTVALATVVAYDDVRARRESSDSAVNTIDYGGAAPQVFEEWSRSRSRFASREVTARQHVGLGRLALNAGARWSAAHGVSTPRAADAARNLDLAYALPASPGGPAIRLRAAYGVSPLADARGIQVPIEFYGYAPKTRTVHPMVGEREAGIDLTAGRRTEVALTYYRSASRDAFLGLWYVPSMYGSIPGLGDIVNRGVEARAGTRLLDRRRLAWDATLTAATLSNRMTASTLPPYNWRGTRPTAGTVLQGYWGRPASWNDANRDGKLSSNEITFGDERYVGPSLPTLEMGLQSALTFGRALRIGALVDYRGGQYRRNDDERFRCVYHNCASANDASLSTFDRAFPTRFSDPDYAGTFIEPSDFVRLREVVVDWDVPAVARLTGLERVGVRVSGQNLATWTRYSGIDPEVGSGIPPVASAAPTSLFESPLPRRILLELRLGADLGR